MKYRIMVLGALVSSLLASTAIAAETTSRPDHSQRIDSLAQQVEILTTSLASVTSNLTQTIEQVQRNRDAITQLGQNLQEEVTRQAELLEGLKSNATAIESRFENELASVRAEVNSKQVEKIGRFGITNEMETPQRITVNEREYEVPAGQRIEIVVPVGQVQTQIVGENAKTWTVGEPTFRNGVRIFAGQPTEQRLVLNR